MGRFQKVRNSFESCGSLLWRMWCYDALAGERQASIVDFICEGSSSEDKRHSGCRWRRWWAHTPARWSHGLISIFIHCVCHADGCSPCCTVRLWSLFLSLNEFSGMILYLKCFPKDINMKSNQYKNQVSMNLAYLCMIQVLSFQLQKRHLGERLFSSPQHSLTLVERIKILDYTVNQASHQGWRPQASSAAGKS